MTAGTMTRRPAAWAPCGRPRPVSLAVLLVLALAVADRRLGGAADGARILAVEPMASRSHWNFMSSVLRALTDAGHRVTAFTPVPDGDRENYAEVDMSGTVRMRADRDFADVMANFSGPLTMTRLLTGKCRSICDAVHADPRLAETVRNGRTAAAPHFDVIVAEPAGPVDCLSYLAHALRLPIVYVIPSPMYTFAERAFTGHTQNPACVPYVMARHGVPKTFAQRFSNALLVAYGAAKTTYDDWSLRAADPRPYDSAPSVRPAVIFQNSHYITEAPRPVPPNVIDVGGIHLKPPTGIPKEILGFIEDSPHGVIYFTFGSTIKFSSLPKHITNAFKKALAKVPQKVLWKYETEMNDMPKNVLIKKWFPQREILLHPKVKLFISHGGISGIYEAVDGSVPILGFPLFYDQPRNLEHLVNAGMAISLDLLNVSEEILVNSISDLINNEKYMNNARVASYRFRDRPMSPAQSVVYWTEYVIRHKGAPHLRSNALNLTWYQYYLLDVIAALVFFISLVLFIIYKTLKVFYKLIIKYLFSKKVKAQ